MTEVQVSATASLDDAVEGTKADLRREIELAIAEAAEQLLVRIPFSKLDSLTVLTENETMGVLRELDGFVGDVEGDALPWQYEVHPNCISREMHVLLLTERVQYAPELPLAEELAYIISVTAGIVNVPIDEVFRFSGPPVIVDRYVEMEDAQRERFRDHLRYSLLPYGYSLNRATVGSTLEVRRDR